MEPCLPALPAAAPGARPAYLKDHGGRSRCPTGTGTLPSRRVRPGDLEFISRCQAGNTRVLRVAAYHVVTSAPSCAPSIGGRSDHEMDPLRYPWGGPGFLLSVALVSPPAIASADTCFAAKLRAAARAVSGRLNCDAKAEAKGRPGGAAGCETKPNAGLVKDFSKVDAKGPCPGSATAVLCPSSPAVTITRSTALVSAVLRPHPIARRSSSRIPLT